MDARPLAILATAMALVVAVGSPALAEGRNFAYTYGYAAEPAGGFGIELRGDFDREPGGRAELGYGVTDQLSVGVKANVVQATGLDALSLEGAARFAKAGQWPVDTGLVVELERPMAGGGPLDLQGILVLEKDLGKFVSDGNLVLGGALAPGGPRYGASWGLGYRVNAAIEPGIQVVYGDTELEDAYGNALFGGASVKASVGHTSAIGGLLFGGGNEIRGTLVLDEEF